MTAAGDHPQRAPDADRTTGRTDMAPVYGGALIAVVLQWSLRLVGLVSVLVLARLLSPADFGVVGLAMTAVAFVEIFSFVGLRQALLRMDAPERGHLDTAWTIQLLLFMGLGAMLIAIAPLVARFYGQPELMPVLMALSLRFACLGLVNIGIVDFDRHLQFGRDMRMRLSSRLLSFIVTIGLAVLLRSYWALVIGMIAQSLFFTIASYTAHPYRPRLALSHRHELLGVSLWMFVGLAAQVVQHQIERIAIGRTSSAQVVGYYSVAKDLSAIFTQEIATALNRVTFVTTARGSRPLTAMASKLGYMLGAYALIAAPMGLGLAAVAENGVEVLLGRQWLATVPLLKLIAPAAALYAVYKLIASSLQASGHARLAAILTSCGVVLTAVAIAIAMQFDSSAVAIATTALLASLAILSGGIVAIARVAQTAWLTLAAHVLRPFAAASMMYMVVRQLPAQTGLPFVDLGLQAGLGATIYCLGVAALWYASGRPPGAEAKTIRLIAAARRSMSGYMLRKFG